VPESKFEPGSIDVYDIWGVDHTELPFKRPIAEGGEAAVTAVIKAVELAMAGDIDAMATAPLHKLAMKMAGYDFPGHTEIIGQYSNSPNPRMMLVAGNLRVVHVSTHVGLKEAVSLVKHGRVLEAIEVCNDALLAIGIENPHIAVAGLNPHAEPGDLFGTEDGHEIAPAVEQARALRINVEGPLPPDTVFARTRDGAFDGAVAMYHDQGHIAVKMLGFHHGINVTVNTPVIRTSVDHGTAYGRAGECRASDESLAASILLAAEMVNTKRGLESAARSGAQA
jgi:4-hydroxythreonine-4-phosphate dehydrogenase